MIPYDDLVAALTAWRARQGLPVAVSAKPASGGTRTGPPAPPPGRGSGYDGATAEDEPVATVDELESVDAAALVEEAHYDNEGDDYAMRFDHVQADAEATAIGGAPEPRDSFGGATDPHRGSGRDDW